MSETASELRHVKPGVWIRQFKQEAAKLGVKEKDLDIAGAHWLKERGKSPKQAADLLHGKEKDKGKGGIPMFRSLVPADAQAIATVLRQQGRDDLARLVSVNAAAPKPADLRKSWQTLFRQVKQLQRSSVVLEKQKAAEMAALLQKVSRALQTLENA